MGKRADARRKRKAQRQSARQSRKAARISGRNTRKQTKMQGKADSGYWSPEAVEARQGTLQAGIGAASKLAEVGLGVATGGTSMLGGLFGGSGADVLAGLDENASDDLLDVGAQQGGGMMGGGNSWMLIGGAVAVVLVLVLVLTMGKKK